MNEVFLGIDVGTTAIKIGVIAKEELCYEQSRKLTTYFGDNGARYQKGQEIIDTVTLLIQEIPAVLRMQVERIGFSVAMHSVMPFQKKIGNVYLWSDTQSSELVEQFRGTELAKKLYRVTGTPIHTMSPFFKILHFKQIGEYGSKTRWYGLKELLMHQFTGEYMIDYSTASATGLFNLENLYWDNEILKLLDLSENQLPRLVDPLYSQAIKADFARELGLSAATRITIGASDGCLAAYGSYISTGVPNSLTVGTSAAVRKVSTEAIFDEERQNFCYYLAPDSYVVGAPSNNGGCVLEWASKILADSDSEFYALLTERLMKSPIGANGLRFHPYINGERAPFWKSGMTAQFKYLTIQHTKEDMTRAVVEGILMNIRILKEMVGDVNELTLSGGFFKNERLRDMTSEVLGVTCYHEQSTEPIFGLYYLIYGATARIEVKKPIQFVQENVTLYNSIYGSYFE